MACALPRARGGSTVRLSNVRERSFGSFLSRCDRSRRRPPCRSSSRLDSTTSPSTTLLTSVWRKPSVLASPHSTSASPLHVVPSGSRSSNNESGSVGSVRGDRVKQQTQVVVIGGGVVGASVLYHLTKAGWTDVMLLERRELTAGSTWHAAGGMHTLNGDPNVARLQQYTIQLYEQIEQQSGQDCSIHLPGGLM